MSTHGSGGNGDMSRGGEWQGTRKVEGKALEIGVDATAHIDAFGASFE
jgi:hypothetical protein